MDKFFITNISPKSYNNWTGSIDRPASSRGEVPLIFTLAATITIIVSKRRFKGVEGRVDTKKQLRF